MIDVKNISYDVIVITESKVQLNITGAVEGLGWSEGEDELAMKIAFDMYNASYSGKKLSSLLKIGCVVAIKAYWGSGKGIVALGNVVECERNTTKNDEIYSVLAYDNLYNMQRSQDNIYFAAGKSTKSALQAVFNSWGISLTYKGPNVTHAKIVYKNAYLSDIVRGILDEAKKKGGGRGIVRSTEGKVSIVKVAGNKEVYCFEASNSISASHKVSITDIVTRVIIVSSEKTEGCPKVEATVNGKTKYGIFQRIVNHASSDNLSEAKTTAQEMLDEDGSPKETSTVVAPDVPVVRKGDMVHLKVGALSGFFVVKSIQHNADSSKMTMRVEKYKDDGSGSGGSGNAAKNKKKTAKALTTMHVRTGPGVNYKSIGYIAAGGTVEVEETTSNNWYKITYKGQKAYTSNAGNKYYKLL